MKRTAMIPTVEMNRHVRGRAPKERWSRLLLLCITGVVSIALAGCGIFGYSDSEAPSPPTNVRGESQDRAVALEWSDVEAQDLAGYNVYRSDTLISNLESAEKVNTESLLGDTSYTDDQGLANGTTYHYVVTAEDDNDNESSPSEEVRRTPFATPPRP